MRDMEPLTIENACAESEKFIARIAPYPSGFAGRGIVICSGGVRYFTCAWVCINMLRRWGCRLPIQIWHLGEGEMSDFMKSLMKLFGVECVDALKIREKHSARILKGWELKAYAILHCPFKEVLLLDADNVPVINPEFLFGTPEFQNTGAIFWPDYTRLSADRAIWQICGVKYRDEPEFESGQIIVDKERCWKALCLAMWYNEHSDFYYQHIHGDKDTFHLAFRKLKQPYSMPSTPIYTLYDNCGEIKTMCQHDFKGNRVFQHRNCDKWRLFGNNKRLEGFRYENECLEYVNELRNLWHGHGHRGRFDFTSKPDHIRQTANKIINRIFDYKRVGHDRRPMTFLKDGLIGQGAGGCEVFWNLAEEGRDIVLEIFSESELICRLKECADKVWRGQWIRHERMPIELSPNGHFSENGPADQCAAGLAQSLFVVSLPRSLSCLVYDIARRAAGLCEPKWTSDGEILNVDRFALYPGPSHVGLKFISKTFEPELFRELPKTQLITTYSFSSMRHKRITCGPEST